MTDGLGAGHAGTPAVRGHHPQPAMTVGVPQVDGRPLHKGGVEVQALVGVGLGKQPRPVCAPVRHKSDGIAGLQPLGDALGSAG